MKQILKGIGFGLTVGLAVGLIEAVFAHTIRIMVLIRENISYLWMGLPLAGLLSAALWKISKVKNTGTTGLFEYIEKEDASISLRTIVPIGGGTFLSHLFGASTGRTGSAIQIGAAVSSFIKNKCSVFNKQNDSVAAGIAAAFAGLFGLPLTGYFFAAEIFDRRKPSARQTAVLLSASYASFLICRWIGLPISMETETFEFFADPNHMMQYCLFGILIGVLSGCFARGLQVAKRKSKEWFLSPALRIAAAGLILAVCTYLFSDRYAGSGETILYSVFAGEDLFVQDWIIKAGLTVVASAGGFAGGEVTPVFTIGACLGAWLAPVFGSDPLALAALGMVGFFAGATDSFFTSAALAMEVFGFSFLPVFILFIMICYGCSGKVSIYAKPSRLKEIVSRFIRTE